MKGEEGTSMWGEKSERIICRKGMAWSEAWERFIEAAGGGGFPGVETVD
jgi:hypothetical protein